MLVERNCEILQQTTIIKTSGISVVFQELNYHESPVKSTVCTSSREKHETCITKTTGISVVFQELICHERAVRSTGPIMKSLEKQSVKPIKSIRRSSLLGALTKT